MMLPLLALAACSPDENAQAQKEAAEAFVQAMTHVNNATAGYPAGEGAPSDGDYDAHRVAELKKAEGILKGLTTKGSNSQKATASMALADVLSELAADASARATATWAEHNNACDATLTTLAEAQLAGGVTGKLQGVDLSADSDQFATLRLIANQDRNDVLSRISQLEKELGEMRRKKDNLDASRKALTLESNDLRVRSHEAKGELRFELHKKSANLSLKADKLGADAERLGQDIAQKEGLLRQEKDKKQLIERQIAGIQRAMGSISSSTQSNQDQAAHSAAQAAALAKELVDELNQLNDNYTKQVRAAYAEATDYTQRAFEASQNANRFARGSTKRIVRDALARRAMSNALRWQEAATADSGYAQLIELISNAADTALPEQQAATIREMHAAANEQAKASNDAAVESLKQAADPISNAAENAKDEDKTEALIRKIGVYATLLDLSGELAYRDQLAEAQGQLQEWRDELAQREAEQAALEAESEESTDQ